MREKNINELVNEALTCWAEVTGVVSGNRDWDLSRQLGDLNESRELDATGLTTFMMLRGLADEIFKDTPFTALELMTRRAEVEGRLAPLRHLLALVETPEVVQMTSEFVGKIRQTASDLGMGDEQSAKLEELLESKYGLAFVRRDSLLSLEKLGHHQFSRGPTGGAELKRNEYVYEFLNVNSAVRAALHQEVVGVSMVLVRDPEVEVASYFAFLVGNGSTVTMLTDREEGPHPLYNRMSRRPDRNLERRAAQNWFPYQLMDLEPCGRDGDRLRVHRTSVVVRYDERPVRLRKISELEPEQFVWAVLMFDVVRDLYGRSAKQLPQLSYTGEMVAEPHALLGPGSELVRSGQYEPLVLPPLTRDEVLAARDDGQWAAPPTNFNSWMEERYGREVPVEYLSVVGTESRLLLEEASAKVIPQRESEEWESKEDSVVRVDLEALSPVTFGTREKLQSDRLWVARVNKMRFVQKLAEAEYEREYAVVYAWWREACARNSSLLLDGLARGELAAPVYGTRGDQAFVVGHAEVEAGNVLRRFFSREEWRDSVGCVVIDDGDVLLAGHPTGDQDSRGYRCHDTGTTPSVYGFARPTCPEALAVLSGVGVDELPWPLRHWYSDAPYAGNSILDRVEPSDWVLHNPWMSSNQRCRRMLVLMCLSRRAFHARRRNLGLPRLEIHPTKNEEEKS